MSFLRHRFRRNQPSESSSTDRLSHFEQTFVQGVSEGLAAPLKSVRHPWRSVSKIFGLAAFFSLGVILIDAWSYAAQPPSARRQIDGNPVQNIVYQATEVALSAKNAALNTVNAMTDTGGSGQPPAPTK